MGGNFKGGFTGSLVGDHTPKVDNVIFNSCIVKTRLNITLLLHLQEIYTEIIVLYVWCARQDLNLQHLASEAKTLSKLSYEHINYCMQKHQIS